jgi:hypothetical protein
MASIDDYNAKLNVISAIPESETKAPNMPVKAFLEEAEFLYERANEDKEALVGAGLDWALVEDLQVRAGALRQAETNWFKDRFNQEEAEKAWDEASDEGYIFRNELLHTFFHAYRLDEALIRRVRSIAAGYGHADMIQDLNNLAGLGKANLEPLQKIRIDPAQLDKAANMSDALADQLASAQVERESSDRTIMIRDQAYTHLKEAVDEIRASGQYVFWRNEKRFQGYISQYHKKFNSKSQSSPDEPAPNEGLN